jgi:glutamyl-tRNA(Gln) amidotransferase subunit D
VIALNNGNYVVRSPDWDNGAVVDAGAVTLGDGTLGTSGAVAERGLKIFHTPPDLKCSRQAETIWKPAASPALKNEPCLSTHCVSSSEEKVKHVAGKPAVSIISTGGTVSSRVDYTTGGVYASYSTSDLVKIVPELGEFNIDSKFLFGMMSEDMRAEHWKEIAKAVFKELKTDARGVVVTHGTDTMHFSTAALSFMLKDLNKPVILTGSQRSSDRGSSDSFINMTCAVNFASKSDVAEVSLVMHGSSSDDFCYAHRGTKVRKLHTSKRDAFKSVNDDPLAKIFPNGKIEIGRASCRERV